MLADTVLAFIQEHQLIHDEELLLVGVSGGADSLCLAHTLASLRGVLGIRLHVAHLDHALRPESAAEAQFVAETAARWGLPFTVERQEVRRLRTQERLSLEEAARLARYGFFARLAPALGAAGVAVGHTADDQVETILLHWIRGTGLAGLRGMQPVTFLRMPGDGQELKVVRPLLSVRRSDTEDCCRAAGIESKSDPSNQSLRYRRNKVRHRLLPALESYNPSFRDTLLRMARIAGRDYAFIEGEVRRVWSEVVSGDEDLLTINTVRARALAPALLYHLLRFAVEKVAGPTASFEMVHLEHMASALARPAGTIIVLPHGVVMAVGYGSSTVSIGEKASPLPPLAERVRLNVPGETKLPGWTVDTRIEDQGPWKIEDDPWTAVLDLDKAGTHLSIRARRPGDRFQPFGMSAEKRLQDFFVDARVPRTWRDRVPLVVALTQIVWVAGWRIDDRVKVTQLTRRALRIQFNTQTT